ncbi:MAG TPA: hypothetical protein V6D47_06145 [Oscillatoriaceae cyanobacterium]
MFKPALRVSATLAVTLLAACTLPNGTYVGGGPLPLTALGVTQVDPATQKVSSEAMLSWNSALSAKTYEVIRQLATGTAKVVTTTSNTSYTDSSLDVGMAASFTVRALSGDQKELTTSNPEPVAILKQQVGKPTGLQPADKATINVGDTPTFSWSAVSGANWYYVTVTNGASGKVAWSALTDNTSLKFGADSTVKLDKFTTIFPTGSNESITNGIVYSWNVEAIRGDNSDLTKLTAIDVNPSTTQTFSQGS